MSDFEYANAPESKAIAKIASSYDLFIGGKFVKPKKGKSFNTINPATEEILAKIDLVQLNQVIQDDEHASYHEDEVYKIDNKHSYTEAILKRLSRFINRGDYKYPEEE